MHHGRMLEEENARGQRPLGLACLPAGIPAEKIEAFGCPRSSSPRPLSSRHLHAAETGDHRLIAQINEPALDCSQRSARRIVVEARRGIRCRYGRPVADGYPGTGLDALTDEWPRLPGLDDNRVCYRVVFTDDVETVDRRARARPCVARAVPEPELVPEALASKNPGVTQVDPSRCELTDCRRNSRAGRLTRSVRGEREHTGERVRAV